MTCRILLMTALLVLAGLPLSASAQLLAVLDRSKPADAGLTQTQLSFLAQTARGELQRRLPESFQVMSEENTVAILRDMGVDLTNCQGECEVETGRKLGADWVVSLLVARFGKAWNLQLNLFETRTGTLKGSERTQVSAEDGLIATVEEKAGLLAVRVGSRADGAAAGRLGGGGQDWEMPAVVGVLLTFQSEPPGATITWDGSYLGETPLTREVVLGPHSLKLSLPRHEDLVEPISVDREATLSRTLTPLFGWLSVESTPADQPVAVDGVRVGQTPLRDHVLGHGPHTVWVGDSAAAYPQGERFTLGKGERKTLAYDVMLRTGGLVVRCVDASGNAVKEPVSVDGQPQGSSPLQLKLPIGEHVVEAGGQRQTVRLVEKQVETVVLTVERAAGQPAGTTMTGPLPGMVFVTIPAGTFQMGSPGSESGRDSDEGPQHQVTLSSYAMMTTEVTQAQWQAMMGSNPSYFKGDDRPVEQVSWNVVQDFITKLNQRDPGKGYRLPTEAEWEFACRAGSTGRWCFGDDEAQLDDYAWTYTNSGDRPLTEDWDVNQLSPNNCRTHPVGQKRANAWGMYDLHGNVWEWCQDWYGNYSRGAVTDPTGAASGSLRVRRGGCWEYTAGYCRSAFRGYVGPSNRNNNLGFRVARTLP